MAADQTAAVRTLEAIRRHEPDVLHLHEPLVPGPTTAALLGVDIPMVGTFHAAGPGNPAYQALKKVAEAAARRLTIRTAVSEDATAFSHRDANYLFHPISMWREADDDEHLIAANRRFCDAMRPFGTGGAYLNFTPEDRVRDAYGAAKYSRLVALKDKYDPENLFRLNQNIRPSRLA